MMEQLDLLGRSFECVCGKTHFVPTREVLIAEGAIDAVYELCERNGMRERCNLVADSITYDVCGKDVAQLLRSRGISLHEIILEADTEADEKVCDEVLSSADPHGNFWVAVGSGTINDITKLVSTRVNQPYGVVATAPSMNGYTSSIVAIMINGLKATLPGNPPLFVLADLNVLCNAPYELITAGLGDALSKPVSNADWMLSHVLFGEHFCNFCIDLLSQSEQLCASAASSLKSREPNAIKMLMEALCISGIVMTIAGSSTPVSGGEHLISHALDMHSHITGRKKQLHGAQVGVATLFSASLYERLLEIDPSELDVAQLANRYKSIEEWMQPLQRFFGDASKVVTEQFAKKYPKSKDELEVRLEKIVKMWDELSLKLRPLLRSQDELRRLLYNADAPTTVWELKIDIEEFKEAIKLAHTIRSRYTVLDLANELCILPDELESLLKRSQIARW